MKQTQKNVLGELGEYLAEQYLRLKGYRILEKNYKTKLGEIDIVATYAEALVFVEVKTRATCQFGTPFDGVGRRKKKKLQALASAYLKENALFRFKEYRFDVVGITLENGDEPKIDLVKDAFSEGELS